MLKKMIICLFALGFFLLPCLTFAADAQAGTVVFTIKDNKGRMPVSKVYIVNTTTNSAVDRDIKEGTVSTEVTLPVGTYRMLIDADKTTYNAVDPQVFTIAAGQKTNLTVTPSSKSSVFTGEENSNSGGTAGTAGTASPSGTGTGSSTAKASGTLSIGSLSIAAPAIFTDLAGFGDKFKRLETALPAVFDIVIYAAGIIFVVLFLVGGIQYLTSAGNEEATGKAKKLLVDAVIGLIIVLASWAIGTWILTNLGVK